MTINEKEAIDAVMDVLTDLNLRHKQDYIFKNISHGCFNIAICPRRFAVLDIVYFYDNIPDIVVFKVKQRDRYMSVVLKIRLRGD